MEIIIKYNTVNFDVDFVEESGKLSSNCSQHLEDYKTRDNRITEWFDEFLELINKTFQDCPIKIEIDNCDSYEVNYLNDIVNYYPAFSIDVKQCNDNKIVKEYSEIENTIEVFKSTKEDIGIEIYSNYKNTIQNNRNTTIEIPVIATMSSGKSTLLNALLGQEILPSANAATTATTCTIIVNNEKTNFDGKVTKGNEIIAETDNSISISEFIKKNNQLANDENDLNIEIDGPATLLDVQGFNLQFIDTPGPNNSQNDRHKQSTYMYLKDSVNLPIILYVLNATQLSTTDDVSVLEEIAKVMKDNKGSIDRIIFVLNKIDEFDPERESIDICINNCKNYLAELGIKKPKIFPVSAFYGLLEQIEQNGNKLTRSQKGELLNVRNKFAPDSEYLGYQLVENSPLLDYQKQEVKKLGENTDLNKHLMYSGILSLKYYIEDYIDKHHKKQQYNKLEDITKLMKQTLHTKIEELKEESKQKSEEEQQQIEDEYHREVEMLKKQMEETKVKIGKVKTDIDSKFTNSTNEVSKTFNDFLYDITNGTHDLYNGRKQLQLLQNKINNLKISVESTLDSSINDSLHGTMKKLKNLIFEDFKIETNSSTSRLNSLKADFQGSVFNIGINTVNDNLSQYLKTTTVVRERTTKNWFKRIFVKKEKVEVSDYIVDYEKFYSDEIHPISVEFNDNIESIKKIYNTSFEDLKKSFKNEVKILFEKSLKVSDRNYKKRQVKTNKDLNKELTSLTNLENRLLINTKKSKIKIYENI